MLGRTFLFHLTRVCSCQTDRAFVKRSSALPLVTRGPQGEHGLPSTSSTMCMGAVQQQSLPELDLLWLDLPGMDLPGLAIPWLDACTWATHAGLRTPV